MSTAKDNILKLIFGNSRYNEVIVLINNVSRLNSINYNYELEFRIVDNNRISCSHDSYMFYLDLFKDIMKFESYTDCVIETKVGTFSVDNVFHRYNRNTGIGDEKILISKIEPCSQRVDIPINVKLSLEKITSKIDNMKTISYQRRQRISYSLHETWRMDVTVRFITNDVDSKKLTYKLQQDNVTNPRYYDLLDIEFEYIGEWGELSDNVFKLFEYLYPSYFKDMNIIYKEICDMYKLDLSNIFIKNILLTNDKIYDFAGQKMIYYDMLPGEKSILIVYDEIIYEMTKTYFKIIYDGSISREKEPVGTIKNSLNKFQKTKKRCKKGLTIIHAARTNKTYTIIDIVYCEDRYMGETNYGKRLVIATKWCKEKLHIDHSFISHKKITPCQKSWSTLLDKTHTGETNGVCIKIDDNSYDAHMIKNVNNITICFKLKYIDNINTYYLYSYGSTKQLLTKNALNNIYQEIHFGYNLFEHSDDVYMLFDTPFKNKTYVFRPSDVINANDTVANMLKNPEQYDNNIVEMLYTEKGWLPISLRTDLLLPTSYPQALESIEYIYDKFDRKYVNTRKIDSRVVSKYNDTISMVYKYILEKYMNSKSDQNIIVNPSDVLIFNEIMSLVDISDIHIISNDRHMLVESVKNIYNHKQPETINTVYHTTRTYNNIHMNVGAINENYETNNNHILNKLMSNDLTIFNIDIYIDTKLNVISGDYMRCYEYISYLYTVVNNSGMIVLFYNEPMTDSKIYGKIIPTVTYMFGCTPLKYNQRLVKDKERESVNILYLSDKPINTVNKNCTLFAFHEKHYCLLPSNNLKPSDVEYLVSKTLQMDKDTMVKSFDVDNMFYGNTERVNVVSPDIISLISDKFNIVEYDKHVDISDLNKILPRIVDDQFIERYIGNKYFMVLTKK